MLSSTRTKTSNPLESLDLNSPDSFAEGFPVETFKTLRAESPVHWHPPTERDPEGFWVVSRYKDVWSVSLDQATFSSARRGTVRHNRPISEEDMVGIRAQMLNMDPPLHTKYRRLVNMGFSPKRVNRLEPAIRTMAARIVDDIVQRGECDFVTDIAAELPLRVIVEMMGVPQADRHLIFDWSNKMIGFDDPDYGGASQEIGKMAAAEMFMYAHAMATDRRKCPRDDLMTVLVEAEVENEKLDDMQLNNFFLLLLVAGNETTRNSMSGGLLALMQHRDQWERLLADRTLVPSAVEEIVRWVSPVMYFVRTATRDVELRGRSIREGERVTLWYPSANRDEEVFPDGHTFDVGRNPNDHLAFGIGPHFCLGANLARMQIRVMFEELLRRLPDIELAGPVSRLRSNFIGGIKSMPVRFTPAH
jgi:cholest-4-en-3-one 26-monooxygenase